PLDLLDTVPADNLLALPSAEFCVTCAEMVEGFAAENVPMHDRHLAVQISKTLRQRSTVQENHPPTVLPESGARLRLLGLFVLDVRGFIKNKQCSFPDN